MNFAGVILISALFWASLRLSHRICERFASDGRSVYSLMLPTWVALSSGAVVFSTEILSCFGWIDFQHLFLVWIVLLWTGIYFSRGTVLPSLQFLKPQNRREQILVAVIVLILVVTGIVALTSAPNNSDSLGYHNARIMHWLSHKNVSHYFTLDHRQLRMPPLISFFRMHAYTLTGHDFLFNFTQWIAYVLSILLAATLGWRLSNDRRVAILSAFLIATVPMAILQSMSSQNDLGAAVFVLSSMLVLVELKKTQTAFGFFLFWTLLGLGALTKGTFYIYGSLIVIMSVPDHIHVLKKANLGRTAVAAAMGIVLALAANFAHAMRNHSYFKGEMPLTEMVPLKVWVDEFPSLPIKKGFDQLLRTGAMQLDLLKKVPGMKTAIIHGVRSIEAALGLPDYDPQLHLHGSVGLGYFFAAPIPDEDYAGSGIQLLLAGLAAIAFARMAIQRREWTLDSQVLGIAILSFLALAVEVKWMPWNNRLLLPAVLLMMVPVSTWLIHANRPRFLLVTIAILATVAVPYLLMDYSHPLLARSQGGASSFVTQPRWNNYFQSNPLLRESVEKIIAELPASCSFEKPVGLVGEGFPEYLLWVGARRESKDIVFEAVQPGADLSRFCAMITLCKNGSFCMEHM